MSQTRAQLRLAVRHELREVKYFVAVKTGTATTTAASTAVTGTDTLFLDEYEPGAEISLDGEIREILSIASQTALTLRSAAAAHTGVTHGLVSERTWTDDDLNDALGQAILEIGDLIWERAPEWLRSWRTAALTAATDVVTLPTALRDLSQVQVRPEANLRWLPIDEIPARDKDRSLRDWRFYSGVAGGGATKSTGTPSGWSFIGTILDVATLKTQIELNSFPPATISDGLRYYGTARLTALASDTATLATQIQDADSLDEVVVSLAVAALLAADETEASDRADRYTQRGLGRLRPLLAQWSAGLSAGPQRVAITSD